MKFQDMPYQRPDTAALCSRLDALATEAARAESGETLLEVYAGYCTLADDYDTAAAIAMARYTINTNDAFYSGEQDFFDEHSPLVSDKTLALYRALLASPHKDALTKRHGRILPDKMQLAVKASDSRLVALQQEDNALATRYEKLYASAKIPFMGKELTLPQLGPYKQSVDRATRRAALEAEGNFFDGHREELDDLYRQMVVNRTQQAQLMGYDSFTPLGDIRMDRLGYTRKDIAACRDAVAKDIVPLCTQLKAQQAARLGVQDFAFYDDALFFKEGNPIPSGTPEQLLEAGKAMYHGLSPQTAEFIDFMMERDLFDVLSRPGKAPGGYCTSIPGYKSPFIFSNFNGTAGDVDVLTHEAGHAFADYVAARQDLPRELRSPALDSCEIHSMSMEFLTSDFHHLFFGPATARYAFYHAADALLFLPYGCMVDEFQETVYDQPTLSPAQRCELWMELERKYRPWNNFAALPFYSRGAGWQRQLHIYENPFYYIDYVLAQCVALDFFRLHGQNADDAWQRYLALVGKAGTETYTGLVHAAGLATPFEAGALNKMGEYIYNWLQAQPL